MKYIKLKDAFHVIDLVMTDDSIRRKGKTIRKRLKELPGADVVEVEHGYWTTDVDSLLGRCCVCSVCGSCPTMEYKYCPYCGAKMDKEEGAEK